MVNSNSPEEFKKKLEEVLKEDGFVNSLLELDSPEEVKAALEEKGIDMSIEEIIQTRDALVKVAEKGASELSEDDLAEVSGGVACTIALTVGIICSVFGLVTTGASLADTFITRSGRRW